MKITRTSIISGKTSSMELDVTQEQLDLYATRTVFVQTAFPQLSVSEREFIKSGMTDAEWHEVFGKTDEVQGDEPEGYWEESEQWEESDNEE